MVFGQNGISIYIPHQCQMFIALGTFLISSAILVDYIMNRVRLGRVRDFTQLGALMKRGPC